MTCAMTGVLVLAACAAPVDSAGEPSAPAAPVEASVVATPEGSAVPSPLPAVIELHAQGPGAGADVIDSDGDGIADDLERDLGTDPTSPDTDGDGLTDFDEVMLSFTDPALSATYDGVPDTESDLDNDGLGYLEEVELGTDPTSPDTDGDGIDDGAEVAAGTDPVDTDNPGPATLDGQVLIYDGGEDEVSITADVDAKAVPQTRGGPDNGHVGWVDVPSMLTGPAFVDVAEDATEVTFVYPPQVTDGRVPAELLVAYETIESMVFLEPVEGTEPGEARVTVTVDADDIPTVVLLDREAHLALLQ
ncbi:hypothetical protein [Demequina litorisediminis]|nr:hypothetical protein [Demequina litorisediminis]